MKRTLFTVTMLVLLATLLPTRADESISVDFFYDNIGSDGSWVQLADYGYCWQPAVAVSNGRWRPYTDGYWAYTNLGWTWVSYEDFGWATYHYGRWVRLTDRGWFWVPGREWGPAWVSWRTGGDYVGWAPLPPRGTDDFIDDRTPITGQVDLVYDIGPAYYNFIDVRYIGEPVLRDRILEPSRNVTYIADTVNVTNITYVDSRVYNYGADYNMVSQYSVRPVQRMTVELNSNVDPNTAVKTKQAVKVQGDKIMVAAPAVLQKPSTPVAPKAVKEKIEKPTLDRGWKEVADPKKEAELKEKMKTEDPRKVPPPSIKPRGNAEQPVTGVSPAAPATGIPPAATANPPNATHQLGTAAPAASVPAPQRGKEKGLNPSPMATAAAPSKPALAPAATVPEKQKKGRLAKPTPGSSGPEATAPSKRQEPPSSLTTSPDGTPFHEGAVRDTQTKHDKRAEKNADIIRSTRQPNDAATERPSRKPKAEPPLAPPNREMPPDRQPKRVPPPERPERAAPSNQEAPPEAHGKHQMPPQRVPPPPQAPPGNVPPKPEASHKGGGEKKSNEPAPTPH